MSETKGKANWFSADGGHVHSWRTTRPLKREGAGAECTLHFLRKCIGCGYESVKVYRPAMFKAMFSETCKS